MCSRISINLNICDNSYFMLFGTIEPTDICPVFVIFNVFIGWPGWQWSSSSLSAYFSFLSFLFLFSIWHGGGKWSPETSPTVVWVCCLWSFWFSPDVYVHVNPLPTGREETYSRIHPPKHESNRGDRGVRTQQTTDAHYRIDPKICY